MSERALSAGRGNERLALRRRKRRRRGFLVFAVLLSVLLGAGVYGLSRPGVRISRIEIFGADPSLAAIASTTMQGSYFGIIPRNSAFFVPVASIRSAILAAHPEIAAVSVFRDGFTGLSIKADDRTPLARWCGSPSATTSPADSPLKETIPTEDGSCYLFDTGGFVYATATEAFPATGSASSSSGTADLHPDRTLTPFVLFAALTGAPASPIGKTLEDADRLPAVLDFARRVGSLGPPVGAIVIRGAEVDFFLATSTQGVPTGPRITYLLGDEQNALVALISAKGQLDLSDPALQYVDLRFSGRIYFKRR